MNTKKKRRPVGVTILLLVIGLVIGGGIRYFLFKEKPPAEVPQKQVAEKPAPRFSEDELVAIVHQARVGAGHLENDRFVEAQQRFIELLPKLPQEPMVVRNLAIARLRLFKDNKIEAAVVEESLSTLQKIEPDAASTHWLIGETKTKQAEMATDEASRERLQIEARQAIERAVELDADNPAFAFQLYDLTKFDPNEDVVTKGYEALLRAYELRPDNIFILTELLSAQVKMKDVAIAKTIEDAKRVLAPLSSTIEVRTRINVIKMLDQAAAAAAMGNWPVVNRNIAPLMGTVRSEEVAKSDLRRIDIDPLEVAVHRLSDALMARYPSSRPAELTEIRFEALELGEPSAAWSDVLDVQAVDFDIDDKLDVVVLRTGRIEAYRLTNQGLVGELIAAVEVAGDFDRLLIADLDQDTIAQPGGAASKGAKSDEPPEYCFRADGDVVVCGSSGFRVLRNEAATGADQGIARRLEAIEQEAGVEANLPIFGAVLVDMDHDGDLDIVASTASGIRLWSNRGKLLFEDLSSYSILPPAEWQFKAIAIVDWDRDVDVDLILSGTNGSWNGILESLRHGQFRWRPFETEFNSVAGAAAVLPLESDGNASWDLAAVGDAGVQLIQTSTSPAESVANKGEITASTDDFDNLVIGDFDNSGMPDLLCWGDASLAMFRNRAGGDLELSQNALGNAPGNVQSCKSADLDADGDLDLLVIADRRLRAMLNQGGNQSSYLVLHCHGDDDNVSGRVNHWGIGSLIELKAGSAYQAQTVSSDTTHFGLGSYKQADIARILWTQGIPQAIVEPVANQVVCEPMMLKGSCPYAYTWNGNRFEFFTDLLWAAPLGLQFADGVIAPDRPWEYLKLPGEKLQAKDGYYELRVTEELWEAGYFDQIQLTAVDHPADVEVYTNEKVGPPSIAEHRIHTVKHRRMVKSATDQAGRDWRTALERADGEVVQAFGSTLRQGLAEPHHLELDLGDLGSPQTIMLFLTGWIRPTDTSLNVALSHHPELMPPKPPSVWVPDANGEWHEAMPYMGFPGGKTKTIAIDLSRLFPARDFRLRIETTAEIYWDEAFFTVNEVPADVLLSPLELIDANLHYRGFSRAIVGPRTVPEQYDYDRVDVAPRWPPMRGPLTRFGDVRPLLEHMDSHLVVMGSGDEISLRFKVPQQEVEPGWQRDFILHNVGWDKDADLNTVFGQTVDPLPYIGMDAYPYIDSHLIDNETYRDYLRTYQTRTEGRDAFWRELLPR